MNRPAIMIVMGNHTWNMQAMHLACALARDINTTVTIVKMVPVRHPLHLGTTTGLLAFSRQDRQAIQDCALTAEDYGVDFRCHIVSYASYISGIASAAQQLDVAIALVPPSGVSLRQWHQFYMWRLRRAVHQPVYSWRPDDLRPIIAREVITEAVELQGKPLPPHISAV